MTKVVAGRKMVRLQCKHLFEQYSFYFENILPLKCHLQFAADNIFNICPMVRLQCKHLFEQYSFYFENILPLKCHLQFAADNIFNILHNMMLTSQKPCQYNNKFDCSETNGYNIPQDAINDNPRLDSILELCRNFLIAARR